MDDEWDTEVVKKQDVYNTATFDGPTAEQLEVEAKKEELERKQAEALKQNEDLGFTAKRNALKAAEKAKVKGNSVMKLPDVKKIEEELEEPVFKPTPSSNNVDLENSKLKIEDPELRAFFEESESKKFSEQAVDFLNAYWPEVGSQAEFIFSGAYKWFVHADMHTKGITLQHLYEEGSAVDYNVAAYFYEKLYYWLHNTKDGKVFLNDTAYKPSMMEMKTAIQLKKDFREKVDVSFDGKISFLEHLLYQYNNVANPQDFMKRQKALEDEHEVIKKARMALEDINEQIRKYEEKRTELEEGAQQPGVKGLSFKHQLSMLDASPLAEALQTSLIKAEAAVRIAVKHYQGRAGLGGGSIPEGSLWWMKRELKAKKEVVVPNTLRRGKK